MCHSLPASVTDESTLPLNAFAADPGYAYFDMSPAQVASRVASLNVAANMVISGSGLNDQRHAGDVAYDLIETAAWLSR
jgi:hypothetical protein